MKEYKLPYDSFIGGWFIDKDICDNIVKYFKDTPNKFKTEGNVYSKKGRTIDKKVKDSTDISIDNYNVDDEIIKYRKELQKVLNLYQKRYKTVKDLAKFNLEGFNIQKYPKKGGYRS